MEACYPGCTRVVGLHCISVGFSRLQPSSHFVVADLRTAAEIDLYRLVRQDWRIGTSIGEGVSHHTGHGESAPYLI